jgi:hypothetical protein
LNGIGGLGCALTLAFVIARVFAYSTPKRAPAARLAQDFRQQPGQQQRPKRQQDQRMRDAAVLGEVGLRPEEADDEVEVGRGAGEEAGGDAPRQ